MNMRGIIAFPPSVCRSWWKPNFIATIIMELSPGVMRAFNEIITKDYLLFFMGLIKSAFVIGGWVRERLDFFFSFSTLTDCMFVSLAVTPFVAGIKACREPQDLIGNLGEKQKREKKGKRGGKYIGFCSVVLMCLNHRALIFMPSKHT